ncbi:lanthionine synthetase LanC family protein [Streptomyces poonensis]|uniref:lanthionine synthetase LanC family protein n=1 Tax=Streptomyces poonensis TaxID=68255 RepID=UPI001E32538D|nr:lanthionine synthetase LanC family protein [Streptomyces poonensis]
MPGWWTATGPTGRIDENDFPGGHANLGLAHGIAGPLALLGLSLMAGVTVPGQAEAIHRLCAWLEDWRIDTPTGSRWPYMLTRDELATRPDKVTHSGAEHRPSWCYGTAGLARALQIAAAATGDATVRKVAEAALVSALTDPAQLALTADGSLCHGWAGLARIADRAASDAADVATATRLRGLSAGLADRAEADYPDGTGLLEGSAGMALAALAATGPPACLPLEQRVRELCDLAEAAERRLDPASASAVHNLAALLASDCGLPGLARQWCHRQADMHLRAHPLDAQAARHALEPLGNLARLHVRSGDGERAFALIDALWKAVDSRTDTTIDGMHLPAARLTDPDEAHHELRRWLWALLLATGARALAVGGRWDEALASLEQHNGVGRRMFDGRQVAVMARLVAGDTSGVRELLDSTLPGDTWEQAVTACLSLLCDGDSTASEEVLTPYQALLAAAPGPAAAHHQLTTAVFLTRLGLTIVDALGGVAHTSARSVVDQLMSLATITRDGYVAREILQHEGCARCLSPSAQRELTDITDAGALGAGELPGHLLTRLEAALMLAEEVIARQPSSQRAVGPDH